MKKSTFSNANVIAANVAALVKGANLEKIILVSRNVMPSLVATKNDKVIERTYLMLRDAKLAILHKKPKKQKPVVTRIFHFPINRLPKLAQYS